MLYFKVLNQLFVTSCLYWATLISSLILNTALLLGSKIKLVSGILSNSNFKAKSSPHSKLTPTLNADLCWKYVTKLKRCRHQWASASDKLTELTLSLSAKILLLLPLSGKHSLA